MSNPPSSPTLVGHSSSRTVLPFLVLGIIASSCLASAASRLPAFKVERRVSSAPLMPEALRGKVVLVDFWEYTCVNWIRTSPYVNAWQQWGDNQRSRF